MSNTPQQQLLTLPALARRLSLPTTWLKAEAAAGRIPSLQAGRRVLFNAEAVENCLVQRAAATPEGGAA